MISYHKSYMHLYENVGVYLLTHLRTAVLFMYQCMYLCIYLFVYSCIYFGFFVSHLILFIEIQFVENLKTEKNEYVLTFIVSSPTCS